VRRATAKSKRLESYSGRFSLPIGTERFKPRFVVDDHRHPREDTMNKDRIEGSTEQAKGKVKEVAGKVTGDSKLENEGKADQVAGKVQNTVGGIKDAVKEAVDD
jgi:uncharacterized protein YjbJ (UPF0337 family)